MPHATTQQFRGGLTLIELLVVIVILATLTAAALPVLTPSTTERRVREATRGLNTFITATQADGIGSGRPSGFVLKRLSSDTGRAQDRGVCLEVYAAEQPAPYAGFDENSGVRIAIVGQVVWLDFVTRGSAALPTADKLPEGWDADLLPGGVIRPGDVLEASGNRYELLPPNTGNTALLQLDSTTGNQYFQEFNGTGRPPAIVARPLNDTGQVITPVSDNQGQTFYSVTGPWYGTRLMDGWIQLAAQGTITPPQPPYWTQPTEYKILRQPVPTSAPAYQLPDGVAIDLEASGVAGQIPFHFVTSSENLAAETENNVPIYVMFTPEGSIERVQLLRNGGIDRRSPSGTVSLLVGRRENIPAPGLPANFSSLGEADREIEKNKINWLNMESRWVNIGARSGAVVTTENAFVNPTTIPVPDFDRDGDMDNLDTRRAQILASQEFAREMQRLGGR